jgi:hypothetical protein
MSIDPIERGTVIVSGLLANYRTGTKLTPDRYVKVPLLWITAAFRALEDNPSLYPAALMIGHLATYLVNTVRNENTGKVIKTTSLKDDDEEVQFGYTDFVASTNDLALMGMSNRNIAKAIKILARPDVALLKVSGTPGKPLTISIRCDPTRLRELKELYMERLNDPPASTRRKGESRDE